jgi:addiction module HigA family antidote
VGLWQTGESRKIPANLVRVTRRKLAQLHFASRLDDLRVQPGNRLEARTVWKSSITTKETVMAAGRKRVVAWNLHPGEILREEFLKPLGITPDQLAKELRVPAPRINDIVREKRGITADTAVRLARFFGTSAEFWMNAQAFYEVRRAGRKLARVLERIEPRRAA